jgi:hypothetical protein
MTTFADTREFLIELISQLFHADVLITEQAERIEDLEAEVGRLRAALAEARAAAWAAAHPRPKRSACDSATLSEGRQSAGDDSDPAYR